MSGGQLVGIVVGTLAGLILAVLAASPRAVRYARPGEMDVETDAPGCLANPLWLLVVAVGAWGGYVVGSALGG